MSTRIETEDLVTVARFAKALEDLLASHDVTLFGGLFWLESGGLFWLESGDSFELESSKDGTLGLEVRG